MKKYTLITVSVVLLLLLSVISFAQLKNGDLVRIKNVNSGKYAQPENNSQIYNAKIVLSGNATDVGQNWKVIAVKGGYYKFQNVNSTWYLGILNGRRALNDLLCQRNRGYYEDVLWKVERSGVGYKLKNKQSNLVAATKEGGRNTNTPLVQWNDNAQPDIIWQFEAPGSGNSTGTGKKVLFDVVLNYLAVSEATRNKIDNGDCKRIFGSISTELWELSDDNEMKIKIRSYNNMPEVIYNQNNYNNPPTAALSYYQDDRKASEKNQMGKVTYNIPLSMLENKRLMLIVKTNLATRHKDNDFASYDALKMGEEIQNTYILDSRTTLSETIETITDLSKTNEAMILLNLVIPYPVFVNSDDTHKIWVKFNTKIN